VAKLAYSVQKIRGLVLKARCPEICAQDLPWLSEFGLICRSNVGFLSDFGRIFLQIRGLQIVHEFQYKSESTSMVRQCMRTATYG
jgi:hypothetical protein